MAANDADFLPLTSENLITAFQNEPILWNLDMRGTEEDKELAWRRIADIFNMKTACTYSDHASDSYMIPIRCDFVDNPVPNNYDAVSEFRRNN